MIKGIIAREVRARLGQLLHSSDQWIFPIFGVKRLHYHRDTFWKRYSGRQNDLSIDNFSCNAHCIIFTSIF